MSRRPTQRAVHQLQAVPVECGLQSQLLHRARFAQRLLPDGARDQHLSKQPREQREKVPSRQCDQRPAIGDQQGGGRRPARIPGRPRRRAPPEYDNGLFMPQGRSATAPYRLPRGPLGGRPPRGSGPRTSAPASDSLVVTPRLPPAGRPPASMRSMRLNLISSRLMPCSLPAKTNRSHCPAVARPGPFFRIRSTRLDVQVG